MFWAWMLENNCVPKRNTPHCLCRQALSGGKKKDVNYLMLATNFLFGRVLLDTLSPLILQQIQGQVGQVILILLQ